MIWFWILVLVLAIASSVFLISELLDKQRAANDMGEYQDPEADPIDNRPRGVRYWLYYKWLY